MPLPLLLIGMGAVSLVSGIYGAKKGVDGVKDNIKAGKLSEEAQVIFKEAEEVLLRGREATKATLEALGLLKLEIWDRDMSRFRRLYRRLHPIELINQVDADAGRIPVTNLVLGEMAELSGHASQVLAGGALGVGAGALAGVAAYGGAMMFGAASTGTAISALAGAAATNATLAWFGGGSLAVGGLGMAGGTAVLGGIVAGPVLAAGGLVIAVMARKNLAKARENLAEAKKAAAEMRLAASILDGIRRVASQFHEKIERVRDRFAVVLDALDAQIVRSGTDYRAYNKTERELVHLVALFAQVMKGLLETPFLTKEGQLRKDYRDALWSADDLLELPGTR